MVTVDVDTRRSGTVTLALGALFLAATGFTCVLSLSEALDPPHWVRVAGLVWLPVGLLGCPVAASLARGGSGRGRARLGLGLLLVGVLVFLGLLAVTG